MFHTKQASPRHAMRPTTVICKSRGGFQRMKPEATFRTDFSSIYEKVQQTHTDDQREFLSGKDIPTTECRGGETNSKSGNVIEVAQVWGASLNFKAHC